MSISIVERRDTPFLGRHQRAEELLEWSQKQKPGERWVKKFPFGLRLGFVSDGDYPKTYIHWNQHDFKSFLKELGSQERFIINTYGICVAHHHGHTVVKLLGAGRTTQVLWDSKFNEWSRKQDDANVNWLVGMVRLTDDRPSFSTQAESQQELEEATAVAIITDTPVVAPITTRLPSTPISQVIPLSADKRAYLLQDVVLNALLSTNSG
jgi:hypothetical protein